jgi:hypothetical protein
MTEFIQRKANEILDSTKHSKIASNSLAARIKKLSSKKAILVDISISMSEGLGNGKSKFTATKEVLGNVNDLDARVFQFSSSCKEVTNREIEMPFGGTNVHNALLYTAQQGIEYVVLITDGIPDSEDLALQAAASTGQKIDVIYIGPDPIPEFLKKLGEVAKGSFERVKLGEIGGITLLTSRIKGFLSA